MRNMNLIKTVLMSALFMPVSIFATNLATARASVDKMTPAECSQLKRSGESGTPEQQTLLAIAYLYGSCGVNKDPVQAAMLFRLGATAGNSTAEIGLADLYMRGDGVGKNEMQAITWLRKAADAGDGDAYAALGQAYENGVGVPKDTKQAFEWYQKGALTGNAESQYRLGNLYYSGSNGAKDLTQAISWYMRATQSGHLTATAMLAQCYIEDDTTDDDQLVPPLLKKSAEGGDSIGQYKYAVALAHGMTMPKDPAAARTWYERAAAQGNEDAKRDLADAAKLESVRSREKSEGTKSAGPPRVDRSIPPQTVSLPIMGIDLKIHDKYQTWTAKEMKGEDVLFSSKGMKVALIRIEDVPCKQKIELYSPTVVNGRAYVAPGWFKSSGEQLYSGTYVADLCLHLGRGILGAMVMSDDAFDSPGFISVVPALDAIRRAAVDKWGEDHSEKLSDLVPIPSDDRPPTPESQPKASLAAMAVSLQSSKSQTLTLAGVQFAFEDDLTWSVDHYGNIELATAAEEANVGVTASVSPIRDCSAVMSRLGGSSNHSFGPDWYRVALFKAGKGYTVCVEGRQATILASIVSPNDSSDPVFRKAIALTSAFAKAIKK